MKNLGSIAATEINTNDPEIHETETVPMIEMLFSLKIKLITVQHPKLMFGPMKQELLGERYLVGKQVDSFALNNATTISPSMYTLPRWPVNTS